MNPRVVSAADKAIDEKQRLGRLYRARQKLEILRACSDPDHGDDVKLLMRSLRQYTINDADLMIDFVKHEAVRWLRSAPEDIRALALRLIDNRIIAIRERAGLEPFDDPMPWQKNNVFLRCKRELGL